MYEDLLVYLWQNKLLDRPLYTCCGKPLTILHPGLLNHNSGPDFSNARIGIGSATWAGNVELHVRSSGWYEHGHHHDPAYHNVILHVVMEDDRPVFRPDGEPIPTLCIAKKYDRGLEYRYRDFLNSRSWIACQEATARIRPVIMYNWLERLAVERLEERAKRIYALLEETQYHWEQVCFRMLCRNFGFKINATPFEMLGRQLPLKVIRRECFTRKHFEAVLLGQAGFLQKERYGQYYQSLKLFYKGVALKHNLTPLPEHIWKFMRMRPANFPTLRLAQMATLLHRMPALMNPILICPSPEKLKELMNVKASAYWDNHYHFDKAQLKKVKEKKLGINAIRLILINTVIPLLFVYGKHHQQAQYQDKAMDWLMQLPGEKNSIVKKYQSRHFPCDHALHSQALLQLRENYCRKKACLRCHLGHELLSKTTSNSKNIYL